VNCPESEVESKELNLHTQKKKQKKTTKHHTGKNLPEQPQGSFLVQRQTYLTAFSARCHQL